MHIHMYFVIFVVGTCIEILFLFKCSVLVWKRFSSGCTANSQTEIEMKDNAAYEEVNVVARSCPQPHPPRVVQYQQEDNIYDL